MGGLWVGSRWGRGAEQKICSCKKKNGKEKIDNKNTESDSEKIRENKKKEFEALYTNVDEKLKTGELVWYSIPELGIKIPVNKKMKEELIYSGTKNSVGFSTTVLMGINPKECGAENAPLGGISRGKGSAEERVYKPCHPVYQDKDTYFCYTSIQSPCLTREQEENNKELLSDGIRIDWESPILWKYIQFTK